MVCCILHQYKHTMKTFFLTLIACVFTSLVNAQVVTKGDEVVTPKNLYGTGALPTGSDSLSTGNIIWITSELAPHMHVNHSEHAYIIDGEADMRLGDKWFKVKNGDVIFIPKGVIHAVKVTSRRPLKVFAVQAPYSDGSDRVYEK